MAKTESTRARKTSSKTAKKTAPRAGGAARTTAARKTVKSVKAPKAAPTAPPKEAKVATPKLTKSVSMAIRAAQAKKALDLVVLDLRKADAFTDFFIICTGQNPRQMSAIADGIVDALREELGERPAAVEGSKKSDWVLVDYFNFIVHIFSPECREFYDLERLWGNAIRHVVPNDEAPTH